MNSPKFVFVAFAVCVVFCFGSAISQGMTQPDFEIEALIYNSAADNFTVRVRNNNMSGQFEGNVSFGIWLNNTMVASNRVKYLYFNDNDAFDVLLFKSSEFAGQVNLSNSVTVKVKVDVSNNVLETNENNNEKSQVFALNPGATALHDLALASIYRVGTHQVKYEVKNAHPQNPFSGTMKIKWSVNEGPSQMWMTNVSNLQPGHSKEFSIPYTLLPGRNGIQIMVDPGNQIAETNENNNSKLVYLYPSIADIKLVEFARLGYQSSRRIINKNTNPALITPDTIGPATSANNRQMHIELRLEGLGSEQVGAHSIWIGCLVPAGTLITTKKSDFHAGPVNGEVQKRDITFWVPKSAASGNKSGMLEIILVTHNKSKKWEIPIKFSGF